MEFAQDPITDVARVIGRAVDLGVIANDPESRIGLAEQMGTLYARVFNEETGGEVCVEDLDFDEIAASLSVSKEVLAEVGRLMVSDGMLKSRVAIERKKRTAIGF